MDLILNSISLPIIAGVVCLFIPGRFKGIFEAVGIVITFITFIITVLLFGIPYSSGFFLQDNLSRFIVLGIGLFGFLIALYSIGYMKGRPKLKEYYSYFLITIGASIGAVLSNHIILLLVFWGILGLTLYLLVGLGGPEASGTAKKTFIMIGGSDVLMILGLSIVWFLGRSFIMSDILITIKGGMSTVAFICLAIAAFTKAGVMPFHTWVPDCAEKAPIPVVALLPASLDKLVGIYLLGRISMDMFIMNKAMGQVLMISGGFTIIAAVMMAMVQHDFRRLLGYHAVSQVGYMVLGIGTGSAIGIAGGLFHMLNNVIYKSCLFLGCGAVRQKTGTTDMDKLGGLSAFMPVTFVTFLIAALSISGVPPLNGFVSKWMIYQGIVELGKNGDSLWILWLVIAMFGSALTLASFVKLIHAVFMGRREDKTAVKEVTPAMWVPMVVLASLCVVFGVLAFIVPLNNYIFPAVPGVLFTGMLSPSLVTMMLLLGVGLGLVIYLISNLKSIRQDSQSYIGGEILTAENRVTGKDFYLTIKDFKYLKYYIMRQKKNCLISTNYLNILSSLQ